MPIRDGEAPSYDLLLLPWITLLTLIYTARAETAYTVTFKPRHIAIWLERYNTYYGLLELYAVRAVWVCMDHTP